MIEFLIANWLLFLGIFLLSSVLALVIQIMNIRRLALGNEDHMYKWFAVAGTFGLIAFVSGLSLFASVILNSIEYFS